MDKFFGILAGAIIAEALITYTKLLVIDRRVQWQLIAGMCIGILVAVGYGIDLFALIGLPAAIPYIGTVLSGILISRGANYIYDLLGKITTERVMGK